MHFKFYIIITPDPNILEKMKKSYKKRNYLFIIPFMEKIKKPAQVLLKGPWTVQIKKSLLNRQLKIANIVEAMIKAKHCHASQLALKLVSKNKIMSRKKEY